MTFPFRTLRNISGWEQTFLLCVKVNALCSQLKDLLGLKFSEVSNPDVWHEDVRLVHNMKQFASVQTEFFT